MKSVTLITTCLAMLAAAGSTNDTDSHTLLAPRTIMASQPDETFLYTPKTCVKETVEPFPSTACSDPNDRYCFPVYTPVWTTIQCNLTMPATQPLPRSTSSTLTGYGLPQTTNTNPTLPTGAVDAAHSPFSSRVPWYKNSTASITATGPTHSSNGPIWPSIKTVRNPMSCSNTTIIPHSTTFGTIVLSLPRPLSLQNCTTSCTNVTALSWTVWQPSIPTSPFSASQPERLSAVTSTAQAQSTRWTMEA